MRRLAHYMFMVALICSMSIQIGLSQESVFTGLRSDIKKADSYFQNESFSHALELYLAVEKRKKGGNDIALKIARTYYQLRDNENTVVWYAAYVRSHETLPPGDDLTYAESLSGLGAYEEAITWYGKYQVRNPKDMAIAPKIWRLKNIQYLYEDSSYYAVRPVSFNSEFSEFGPVYFQDGLVFVSNQRPRGRVHKTDGVSNAAFQTLFYSKITIDTVNETVIFKKPKEFCKELETKFHNGTVTFFPGQEKMILTKNVLGTGNMESTLQLFVVQRIENLWKEIEPFAHNNPRYSISHPTLTTDGKTLYFVSDMPGGFGGKDLYKCTLVNGVWTKPENVGPVINSPGDETFPFYHGEDMLYFASSGHGGFGGLDIFKVKVNEKEFGEVQNIGYPVNTRFDDFGIALNVEGTKGFISSNRSKGGLDDDIFEIEVDLQTYPLKISGTVSYKASDGQDSSKLLPLPHATLSLIDNKNNLAVHQTVTDSLGHFIIEIPYSSQYKIEVFEGSIGRKLVSLEIPKNKKLHTNHQIVVVQDQFMEIEEDVQPDLPPIKKKSAPVDQEGIKKNGG